MCQEVSDVSGCVRMFRVCQDVQDVSGCVRMCQDDVSGFVRVCQDTGCQDMSGCR